MVGPVIGTRPTCTRTRAAELHDRELHRHTAGGHRFEAVAEAERPSSLRHHRRCHLS